jgi:NADPH:quinone reductase-like Zn-dependent oxidoreductase
MKALVYLAPETLEFRDTADPSPGADETLVEVEHVGIADRTCTPGLATTSAAPHP